MKQRFSSLDLKAVTGEINEKLQGTRLANIYDLNSRTFVLKFAKQGEKHNILIESGYRVHLTDYSRETATTPSNFCAKLRKHVRTRRITHARQLGTDRVLVLTFGGGENNEDPERSYYIILEFYAGGNVILTDGYHKILSLLRVVGEDEGQKVSVGETYDFGRRTVTEFVPISRERLADVIEHANTDSSTSKDDQQEDDAPRNALQSKKTKVNKKKEKGAGTLKKVLSASLSQYGAALVEHCILKAGLSPSDAINTLKAEGEIIDSLLTSFSAADDVVRACSHSVPGYIIVKVDGEHEVYDDFQPFLPEQVVKNASLKYIEVETYNACVDKFFSSLESQKLEQRIRTQETLAARRIQAAKDEHQKKISGLVATQETSSKKAAALEGSQGIVDEAINAVNNLLEQGMDWLDIERLIGTEAKQGNPVAQLIKLPLKLHENKVTVLVRDIDELYEEDSDSGDETDSTQESSSSESSSESDSGSEAETKTYNAAQEEKTKIRSKKLETGLLAIDVDLSETAFANARQYYSVRRTAISKEDKTQQASKKALRSTQQKIERDLKKSLNAEKSLMRQIRKVYWFEKFLWFISSDGYLVLGGHDAQQNEQLYRRHFRKGDIYVHADLNGASSVIIKNTHADQPIPPSTLSQAGTLSVATSQAWDAKMVISAWYVDFEQVSKTAPTGEYLTTGSFMVRGKKNFLPPAKLELGFGLLYVVDEASRDRHVKAKINNSVDPIDSKRTRDLDLDQIARAPTNPLESRDSVVVDHEDAQNGLDALPVKAEPKPSVQQSDASTQSEKPHEKYALDEYGHSREVDLAGQFSGKAKHMTAKDRRDARKIRATGTSSVEEAASVQLTQEQQESHPAADLGKNLETKSREQKQQPPTQLTRGQKAKKKKMAKYADQDDEDRLLAQKLLGIQVKDETKEETAEAVVIPQKASNDINERNKSVQSNKSKTSRVTPEVAAIMKEEGLVQLDEDEQEQITPLDIFVSQPMRDDVLLEAIPTCAPYGAMSRYKYKCKLQPGSTKKGKALRGVLAGWVSGKVDDSAVDVEALWPRERDLMKGLKDQELVAPVGVSKVKVSLKAGEVAAKKKAKRSSKK